MMGKINNGKRLPVRFGDYAGEAGIALVGEAITVAFRADARQLRRVSAGSIDGKPFKVVAVEKSPFVTGMVRLTVEPIAEVRNDV